MRQEFESHSSRHEFGFFGSLRLGLRADGLIIYLNPAFFVYHDLNNRCG
jgi:hypothetical protein